MTFPIRECGLADAKLCRERLLVNTAHLPQKSKFFADR